jgi:hypothetical protein
MDMAMLERIARTLSAADDLIPPDAKVSYGPHKHGYLIYFQPGRNREVKVVIGVSPMKRLLAAEGVDLGKKIDQLVSLVRTELYGPVQYDLEETRDQPVAWVKIKSI